MTEIAIAGDIELDMRCPTCGLGWKLFPPVKCDGSNHYRCIECKAVYSSEMLAAPDMLEALQAQVKAYALNIRGGEYTAWADAEDSAQKLVRAAIAKATGVA